jgi:uncharacterized protein YjiS (DUF1127 family)|tara:strand:- start:318 stop:479 length:162 start_codon:yes stop_codon:yes gene_type:complete
MFKNLIKKIQDNQARRVGYWQLTNLSDYQLKDIGITRGEIEYRFYSKEAEVHR